MERKPAEYGKRVTKGRTRAAKADLADYKAKKPVPSLKAWAKGSAKPEEWAKKAKVATKAKAAKPAKKAGSKKKAAR